MLPFISSLHEGEACAIQSPLTDRCVSSGDNPRVPVIGQIRIVSVIEPLIVLSQMGDSEGYTSLIHIVAVEAGKRG